jgi:hypothetical protein
MVKLRRTLFAVVIAGCFIYGSVQYGSEGEVRTLQSAEALLPVIMFLMLLVALTGYKCGDFSIRKSWKDWKKD